MLKKRFFKTKDECDVTFEVEANGAEEVFLVCNFNDWVPVPLKKNKKSGAFRTKVRLPKNEEFQFRYLIDKDNWVNEAEADATVPNEYGGVNSVVSTTPAE